MGRENEAPAFAYKISPLKEGGLFAATIGVILFGYVIGPRYIRRVCSPCDSATINRFDRDAIRWHSRSLGSLSYAMEVAAIAAPPLVALCDRGLSREFAGDICVYAEALALGSALNITIKTLIQRPIPQLYTGLDPALARKASAYRSFYSGHSAGLAGALVASAVMSRQRGRKRAWPWPLAAAATAAVSFARVGAGRHFYSDVVVGALAGGAVGSLVPLLHPARRPLSSNPREQLKSHFVPAVW